MFLLVASTTLMKNEECNDTYITMKVRILSSEKSVTEIMRVLSEEYRNPFDIMLDPSQLVNFSSGVPLDDTSVLECWKIGEQKYKYFVQERLSTNQTAFHKSIKRNKISLFKQTSKSTKISKNGKTATIEVNRNMIGKLLAISAKCEKVIDFEVALSFALTSTPLLLSNPDGTRRVTQKSKLVAIIRSYQDEPSIQRHFNDAATFVVDFIALVMNELQNSKLL